MLCLNVLFTFKVCTDVCGNHIVKNKGGTLGIMRERCVVSPWFCENIGGKFQATKIVFFVHFMLS